MVAASQMPYAMCFFPDGSNQVLLASDDVLSSPPTHDAQELQLEADSASLLDSCDAFRDDEAIVSSLAITADGFLA